MVTVKSTPLDSPLYQMDPERGVEYWGCRAVMAGFIVAGDVSDLVPHGLHLDTPAVGAVLIADYGASTLGPYAEYVSILRVTDDNGTAGLYVPYIYVTVDSAMAAGREVLGAPKKIASIGLDQRPEAIVGYLNRPAGTSLAEVIISPSERLPAEVFDAFLPSGTPMFSLRNLPGPPGATQVCELIQWNCDLALHKDAFGDDIRFTGPGSITYPAHSGVDPVHRLEVDTFIAGAYVEFDMRLTAGKVVWSDTLTALSEFHDEKESVPTG
ncbi:MAG TPA: acetoacetate decarboxylase family protein [Acidimicrobiales bacterium]|nr:acetoacetate decarboxylase family protein [Acidimicrobiales bacterium]